MEAAPTGMGRPAMLPEAPPGGPLPRSAVLGAPELARGTDIPVEHAERIIRIKGLACRAWVG